MVTSFLLIINELSFEHEKKQFIPMVITLHNKHGKMLFF